MCVHNDVFLSKSMVQDLLGFAVALFWSGNCATGFNGFPNLSSTMLNKVSQPLSDVDLEVVYEQPVVKRVTIEGQS